MRVRCVHEMRSMFAFLYFASAIAIISCDSTITVPIGSIATVIGYQHSIGYVFYGIPYAQPPIGQNRFAPPQRKDPAGRFLAFHYGASCNQPVPGNNDEDCLYLNIWTPKMTNFTANKYPVYFFIHGGAFVAGSGNLDTDGAFKNLVSRDIIIVSINYRLGMWGFFSTRDSTVPGNMAILDQIEALHWVKRYISYFGGDPNAITIGGESAGGMSVTMLSLSPLAKGLFKAAIVEGASVFGPGGISYSDSQTDACKQAAIKLGCSTAVQWDQHNPILMNQMLQCMRSKTVAELTTVNGGWPNWGAVRDNNVFPDRLENLVLKRPPIPLLIGNCKNESFAFFQFEQCLMQTPNCLNQFTRQATAQYLAGQPEFHFYNNSAMVLQQATAAYVDSMPFADHDNINWFLDNVQLYTEMVFVGPNYREAMNFRHTKSQVFVYSFDYLAPGVWPSLNSSFRGVTHFWESQYIFGYPGTGGGGWQITSADTATENYFGLFWTNFIKFGNPTPAPSAIVWPQLGISGEYMSMGPVPTPSIGFHPKAAFWACTVPAIEGYKPAWCP